MASDTRTPAWTDRVLLDEVVAGPDEGFAFDRWYHNRHVAMLRDSGLFETVRCYVRPGSAAYLAVCELAPRTAWQAIDTLPAPAADAPAATHARHRVVQATLRSSPSRAAHALEAPFLYPVTFAVPPQRVDEFDRWYEDEHVGMLHRCEHWPTTRRLRRADGDAPGAWTHLALHYLTDLRALESPERDAARSTPWRDRLAAEPWFRGVYQVWHRVCATGG